MASTKWIGRFAVAVSALLAGHPLAASAGPNLVFEPATGAVISQAATDRSDGGQYRMVEVLLMNMTLQRELDEQKARLKAMGFEV